VVLLLIAIENKVISCMTFSILCGSLRLAKPPPLAFTPSPSSRFHDGIDNRDSYRKETKRVNN